MLSQPQSSPRKRITGTVIDAGRLFGAAAPAFDASKLAETEAERAVIGAVLRQPELFWPLSERLANQDFFWLKHAQIWATFEVLAQRGEPIDALTVVGFLDAQEKALVKGDQALHLLTDLYAAPPVAEHALAYAERIRDAAMQMRVAKASATLFESVAVRRLRGEALKDEANRLVFEATEQRGELDGIGMARTLAAYQADVEARMHADRPRGVATGWEKWDHPTQGAGGLHAGEVTVLAGFEGHGKTTWALSLIRNVLVAKGTVALFSLEMRRPEIMQVLVAQESSIAKPTLRDGTLNSHQRGLFAAACDRIRDWSLFTIDEFRQDGTHPLTPLALKRRLRVLLTQTPIDLVVIDGLWLMEPDDERERGQKDRPRAVGKITSALSDIAKGDAGHELPILVLHQYRDDAYHARQPALNLLAESAGVRRNVQAVIALWRNANVPNVTEAHLLKDRAGGNAGYVGYFKYNRDRSLYEERR